MKLLIIVLRLSSVVFIFVFDFFYGKLVNVLFNLEASKIRKKMPHEYLDL